MKRAVIIVLVLEGLALVAMVVAAISGLVSRFTVRHYLRILG